MSTTFRAHALAPLVVAVGLLVPVGLLAPAAAHGATEARCSVGGTGAGSPAAIRVRCVAKRPTGSRTVGTATRRARTTCTIAHLGALDPAALRIVCR